MVRPPPLPSASSTEPPLDRALGLLAEDDAEGAVRWAAAVVKDDLTSAPALFVLAEALEELEKHEQAIAALEIAADRAADLGNLPMAIAALSRLTALGADTAARAEATATAYAKGSPQLRPNPAPALAPPKEVHPLAATLVGDHLIDEVKSVLDYAREALDGDRSQRTAPPSVSPQSLFSSLSAPALRAFIEAFEVRRIKADESVIEQGAEGAEAFVLARGELEVVRDAPAGGSVLLARLGNGALFGEMALLSRSPRAANVVAARPSIVLIIRVEALDDVASRSPEVAKTVASYCQRRMVANLIRTSALLQPLSAGERQALIERFNARTFETDDVLISQGAQADGLYVVASGQVRVVRKDDEERVVIAHLGVGEVVGEVSLVLRRPSNAQVVADHPTVAMHLPRERFMEIVREHPTLLAQLYELAVKRDEETASIVAEEASVADDLLI
ncbi:MAG TPA: cyclic nucleotide-binding domain-containing protein [Polyangiaceae bacterium]|jgi:cAMP-dependent protein kinase regulator|nr:cyclic nucleotide-binding domain-containing protein [Polyangiaceae bacterium]